MGDRANVVVRDGDDEVWLYTHWRGSELPEIVRSALAKKERWTDGPYLARIVFQEMLGGDTGTTGFGIWNQVCDNEHEIIVLDVADQSVKFYPASDHKARGKIFRTTSFSEYMNSNKSDDPAEV